MRPLIPFLLMFVALALVQPTLAEDELASSLKATTQPLLKALSLVGTPYKFGGQNPEKGIDCSGFVRLVYKQAAALELPRTAREMSRKGEKVAKDELQPGDLVFFNTRKKANSHVGIYAGNGEFVHASSRKAKEVTVSSLGDQYWTKHYNGARRLLSGSEPAPAAEIHADSQADSHTEVQ